jgi:hypothetical protein
MAIIIKELDIIIIIIITTIIILWRLQIIKSLMI